MKGKRKEPCKVVADRTEEKAHERVPVLSVHSCITNHPKTWWRKSRINIRISHRFHGSGIWEQLAQSLS